MLLRKNRQKLPPGPRGKPVFGSLFAFQKDPLQFLTAIQREHGDIARFRIPRKTIIQVSDPELIRDILVTNSAKFRKTGYLKRATPILGNGLVTSDGQFHRRQRRLIQPALDRKRVRTYDSVIVDSTAQLSQSWQDGECIDMFDEMLVLALKIITRALFSTEIDIDAQQVESSLTVVLKQFSRMLSPFGTAISRLSSPRNRRFEDAKRVLDGVVQRMIHERRKSGDDRGDVLSMLLLAQDDEGDGTGMSDQQVRDEVMTLFTAGHETIATALTWTWYALATHKDIYATLCDEVDRVVGERTPTASDVPKLGFTEMVFAESMRLFPPIWGFTRLVDEDHELGGYSLPAGSIVGLSQYVVHRDPRHFDDPEVFDPSRWTPEARGNRPKYSYFPFGGGPRLCIGEPFAWLEGILVLATLCREWQPEIAKGYIPDFQPLITLRPKQGMPMRLHRREKVQGSSATREPSTSTVKRNVCAQV